MSKTVSKLLVIMAGFLVIGLLISGCDNPFADGLEPLSGNLDAVDESGSATATAVLIGDSGPTDTVWKGKGGDGYDVVPTVFCVDENNPGPELDAGDPEYIHPAIGYKQDGNKSIATAFSGYVDTRP